MRKELERLKKEELINKILELQEELKKSENNQKNYADILEDNRLLGMEVSRLSSEMLELKCERHELKAEIEMMKYKRRNAGRKKKCDDEEIAKILEARKQNKSMRVIAKEFGCSLGLVQKIINEHKDEIE